MADSTTTDSELRDMAHNRGVGIAERWPEARGCE